MYCINCGEKLVSFAKFCGACGTKVHRQRQEPTSDGLIAEVGASSAAEPLGEIERLREKTSAGDAAAQVSLGTLYADGQGVPQDDAEAVRWYRLGADQGYAAAQHNLGVMYANGRGVAQDDAEAVRWLRLAADQGDAEALQNLGGMHADGGAGLDQDAVTADMWYTLAFDRKPELIDNEQVSGLRESLKERMSSEQIAEAQRLAREWDAAHPRN